jgi:methionyl-tRNA formyltransferase
VVTRPDRRRGRRAGAAPRPVKAAALDAGLPVSEDPADVITSGVDLAVVVAYGRLIRPPVLAAAPMVNLHFSLLPRWRGAAPVERAILAGDPVTGVCLMALEEGLDTGGVYRRHELAVGPDETAEGLRLRLAEVGTASLVAALRDGLGAPEPQVGPPTYAAKILPEDLRLDWTRPAEELARLPRVGRAWTTWRGRRLLVLEAVPLPGPAVGSGPVGDSRLVGDSGPPPGVFGDPGPGGIPTVGTGEGRLALRVVQPEGRSRLGAEEWFRGARPDPDERLGQV